MLFTGYAPVHFVCFQPLYERLTALPQVDVRVSGGLRTKARDGTMLYDAHGMYAPFGLDPQVVLSVEEIRERDFDLLFCANTNKIEPRAFARSIEIFHGMSFRNRAIRPANGSNDHYFMLGPYMKRGFEREGLLSCDDPRAVEIGFPKTDRLLNGELDRATILRAQGLAGDRPVVLYAPTGAKRNSLETIGEEAIGRLAATDAYDLLIKPHDHPKKPIDWLARLERLEDEHVRLVREPDVIPSLFVSDLLITDASSVANEYTLLDRPIVFLDVPELLARAAASETGALDLETWGRKGGQVVDCPEAVVEAVARGLAEPEDHAEVRAGIARDLFYHPGRATDAAIAWIEGELEVA